MAVFIKIISGGEALAVICIRVNHFHRGFAREMLKPDQWSRIPAKAAASYYKMAIGMYNLAYYGHAWKMVQYYRSGSDCDYLPEGANGSQKEYFGACKVCWLAFKINALFPQFVKDDCNMPFYKEAYCSCSYFRDFVKKR